MDTKKLRQKILDLAIRGKLVPQDQNDEPASVLLERIREEKKQMVKEGKLKAKDIKNDTIIFKGEDNLHYEKFQDGTVKCIEDEIPFEVPEGWEWTRARNITCKIGAGSTPTGGASVYSGKGIKFIRSQNVYEDGLFLDDIVYISEEINNRMSGSVVFPKDILLNITGGSIGRSSLVPDDFDIGNVNQHVLIVRMVDLDIRQFIHNVIISPYIQNLIIKRQVGSGRGGLSAATFSDFLMPIPSQNEQHRIVKKLSETLSLISAVTDNKEEIAAIIDATKSKVLDLAIRGKLVPQDPNDEPASVLIKRIRAEKEVLIKQGKLNRDKKESIIYKGDDNSYYQTGSSEPIDVPYEIPETWVWSNLKELCNYGVCDNISPETINSDAWILDLEDIEKDTGKVLYRATNAERKTTSTKHSFRKGMILYSKLRPYLNKVVLADEDGYCTSEIIPLQFSEIILPRYAQLFLMSPFFVGYANHCSYGMKMPRLGTHDGEKALFAIPPYQEQSRIVDMVDKLHANIDIILESLTM